MTHDQKRHRITDAAALVFAAFGYLRGTVDEIASSAAVDVDDIWGEFDNKYDLFAAAVLRASATLLSASDHLTGEVHSAREARRQLIAVVEATAKATVAQRRSSGFYRGEVLHLRPEDRALNQKMVRQLLERIRTPLAIMRPELQPDDTNLLASAALSTIASITVHPTDMPEAKVMTLLTTTALRVLDSALAKHSDIIDGPELHFPWHEDSTPRWRVQRAATRLFSQHGFDLVTAEDIAAASGEPSTVIDAEFGDTLGILVETCQIGYEELRRIDRAAIAQADSARDVLAALCHNYVHYSFEEHDGMTTFLRDGRRLGEEHGARMLGMQADIVGEWVRALMCLRPELSLPEAQFLVFAGMCIVNDWGRATDWARDELTAPRIERAVITAMANPRN